MDLSGATRTSSLYVEKVTIDCLVNKAKMQRYSVKQAAASAANVKRLSSLENRIHVIKTSKAQLLQTFEGLLDDLVNGSVSETDSLTISCYDFLDNLIASNPRIFYNVTTTTTTNGEEGRAEQDKDDEDRQPSTPSSTTFSWLSEEGDDDDVI